MIRATLFFVINILLLFLLSNLLDNFQLSSILSGVVFLFVLTFLDWTLLPLLKLFSLPINLLTFGFIGWLINLFGIWLASILVNGIDFDGNSVEFFFSLVLVSLVLSVVSPAVRGLLGSRDNPSHSSSNDYHR